jgi:hypothetical protein
VTGSTEAGSWVTHSDEASDAEAGSWVIYSDEASDAAGGATTFMRFLRRRPVVQPSFAQYCGPPRFFVACARSAPPDVSCEDARSRETRGLLTRIPSFRSFLYTAVCYTQAVATSRIVSAIHEFRHPSVMIIQWAAPVARSHRGGGHCFRRRRLPRPRRVPPRAVHCVYQRAGAQPDGEEVHRPAT